jgi:hypothetical protein
VGGLLEGVASAGGRVGAGTPGEAPRCVGSVEEERGARVTAAAVSHCKDGWSAEGGHDKQGTDLPDLMFAGPSARFFSCKRAW